MAWDFSGSDRLPDPHGLADWWLTRSGGQPSDEAFIRKMIAEGQESESDTTYNGVLVWRGARGDPASWLGPAHLVP